MAKRIGVVVRRAESGKQYRSANSLQVHCKVRLLPLENNEWDAISAKLSFSELDLTDTVRFD